MSQGKLGILKKSQSKLKQFKVTHNIKLKTRRIIWDHSDLNDVFLNEERKFVKNTRGNDGCKEKVAAATTSDISYYFGQGYFNFIQEKSDNV